jgi:uncharacterized protein YktA (UPF0223 family)
MKTVINPIELEINSHSIIHFINSFEELHDAKETQVDGDDLLAKINLQFDAVYKSNQTRKYLLKEISNYILKK